MKHIFSVCLVILLVTVVITGCSKEARFSLTTDNPVHVSACRATFIGEGKHLDDKKVAEKGFCYNTQGKPQYADNRIPNSTYNVSRFSVEVNDLLANTTYHLRAYIKLKSGALIYGNEIAFNTNDIYLPGDTGPAKGIIFLSNPTASIPPRFSEVLITSAGLSWGCSGKELQDISTTGTGLQNTLKIEENCGANTAAGFCSQLNINGASDWYLPASIELSVLSQFARTHPDLIPIQEYWSSSQKDANTAYSIDFAGSQTALETDKNMQKAVAAVRSFN